MTTQEPSNPSSHLDAYLDGQMNRAARQAFEASLKGDPQLRAELDCQRLIDASMQRLFTAATPSQQNVQQIKTLAQSNGKQGAPIAPLQQSDRRGRFHAIATIDIRPRHAAMVAAVILLSAWLGWQFWPSSVPSPPRYSGGGYGYPTTEQMTPVAYYQMQITSGFEPAWECPPEQFAQVTGRQLGQPLSYTPPSSPRVAMLGVSYANVITPRTVAMLGRVSDQPVMVLIDRADAGPEQTLAAGDGLHMHQRRVGALILYEITPLSEPQMLPMFFLPEPGTPGGPGCVPH